MKRGIITIIICALCFWTLPAQAELVTIQIIAEVYGVNDPSNLLYGRINVGSTITGTYTYDTSTPDSSISPWYRFGDYWHHNWPSGVILEAGGFTFQTDPDEVFFVIYVRDNHPPSGSYGIYDSYSFHSNPTNLPLYDNVEVRDIWLNLFDPTAGALSSDLLFDEPPALEDWEIHDLNIGGGIYSSNGRIIKPFEIFAEVRSLELIPEPATILLFGLGIFLLLRKRT